MKLDLLRSANVPLNAAKMLVEKGYVGKTDPRAVSWWRAALDFGARGDRPSLSGRQIEAAAGAVDGFGGLRALYDAGIPLQ